MFAQIEKSKENKSRAVANSVVQKRSDGKQGSSFVDNRAEALVQRKLKKMTNNNHKSTIQRAAIVEKAVGAGFHHWELQYGGDEEEGLGPKGHVGVISATGDRDAQGVTGKVSKLLKGEAIVRVVDKHLGGYDKVGDLEDKTIDSKVVDAAKKLKGSSIAFNQITNNCQDFVSGIWNGVGGTPDPTSQTERNIILNEFTRSPTPEEVAENMANMYLYM
jgi:hypothetical protein